MNNYIAPRYIDDGVTLHYGRLTNGPFTIISFCGNEYDRDTGHDDSFRAQKQLKTPTRKLCPACLDLRLLLGQ